jgi:Transcriptional regulator PadR-like family
MVLKTLQLLGPLHGYGIARRIEQISGDVLAVNQGTLYPLLSKQSARWHAGGRGATPGCAQIWHSRSGQRGLSR